MRFSLWLPVLVVSFLAFVGCGGGSTPDGDPGAGGTGGTGGSGGVTCSTDCAALEVSSCQQWVCNDGSHPGTKGECVQVAQADGTACDDGNLCTVGDACRSGACSPGSAKDCAAAGSACTIGYCDVETGSCATRPAPNGASCDDGDACTVGDKCSDGVCTTGGPKDCSAFDSACTVGVCGDDGECTASPFEDGTACDDGDACTSGDACERGFCFGGPPKDCSGLTSACVVGVCDRADGECTTAPAANGKSCDDGNLCTVGDQCVGGVCQGAPKSCSTNPCIAGTCNPDDGQCSQSPRADGDPCDPDPCTVGGMCADGTCVGGTTKDCSALDSTCTVGTCDSATGACVAAVREDEPSCACPGEVVDGVCVQILITSTSDKASARAACSALGAGWALCPATMVCNNEVPLTPVVEHLTDSGCACGGGFTKAPQSCGCSSTQNLYIHVENGTDFAHYVRNAALAPSCMASTLCNVGSEHCGAPLCCKSL